MAQATVQTTWHYIFTATAVGTYNPAHHINPIKPNVHINIKLYSYLTKYTETQLQQQTNTRLIMFKEKISIHYEKPF